MYTNAATFGKPWRATTARRPACQKSARPRPVNARRAACTPPGVAWQESALGHGRTAYIPNICFSIGEYSQDIPRNLRCTEMNVYQAETSGIRFGTRWNGAPKYLSVLGNIPRLMPDIWLAYEDERCARRRVHVRANLFWDRVERKA